MKSPGKCDDSKKTSFFSGGTLTRKWRDSRESRGFGPSSGLRYETGVLGSSQDAKPEVKVREKRDGDVVFGWDGITVSGLWMGWQ